MKPKMPILLLVFALLLAACGNTGRPPGARQDGVSPTGTTGETSAAAQPTTSPTEAGAGPTGTTSAAADVTGTAGPIKKLNVTLFVNGVTGDKSFFDSAVAGVRRAERELGAHVRVVEEPTAANWEPALRRIAQGDSDIIMLGTFQLPDILNSIAPDFPEKKFIFFDATVEQPNVANITYAQNEGSFLAGALAGCVVNSDLPNLSGEKIIGAVGGEDINVINDFIVGYEQGAQYVDPEIEVRRSYIGGQNAYNDPAKGKELANAQFDDGANVVFQVAGGSGFGVIDAAKDQQRYAIGVDSNQNGVAPGVVLSSMLKRVDNSVFDLIQMEATGSLRTGKTYPYGIQNNGVGLAEDEYYKKHVPEQCQQTVDKAKQDIASKKVRVKTAFGGQ
ncbi:MAG: BMP family ABC transporter substrate-binding protein [Chloroflexota bacterium]|nr:BMP family ABC transporter substrate-binding protein [Chloroflexota bacterium]